MTKHVQAALVAAVLFIAAAIGGCITDQAPADNGGGTTSTTTTSATGSGGEGGSGGGTTSTTTTTSATGSGGSGGCGGDAGGSIGNVCAPGAQVNCDCPGSPDGGTQICNPDGTGYGPCDCGGGSTSSSSSGSGGSGGGGITPHAVCMHYTPVEGAYGFGGNIESVLFHWTPVSPWNESFGPMYVDSGVYQYPLVNLVLGKKYDFWADVDVEGQALMYAFDTCDDPGKYCEGKGDNCLADHVVGTWWITAGLCEEDVGAPVVAFGTVDNGVDGLSCTMNMEFTAP